MSIIGYLKEADILLSDDPQPQKISDTDRTSVVNDEKLIADFWNAVHPYLEARGQKYAVNYKKAVEDKQFDFFDMIYKQWKNIDDFLTSALRSVIGKYKPSASKHQLLQLIKLLKRDTKLDGDLVSMGSSAVAISPLWRKFKHTSNIKDKPKADFINHGEGISFKFGVSQITSSAKMETLALVNSVIASYPNDDFPERIKGTLINALKEMERMTSPFNVTYLRKKEVASADIKAYREQLVFQNRKGVPRSFADWIKDKFEVDKARMEFVDKAHKHIQEVLNQKFVQTPKDFQIAILKEALSGEIKFGGDYGVAHKLLYVNGDMTKAVLKDIDNTLAAELLPHISMKVNFKTVPIRNKYDIYNLIYSVVRIKADMDVLREDVSLTMDDDIGYDAVREIEDALEEIYNLPITDFLDACGIELTLDIL